MTARVVAINIPWLLAGILHLKLKLAWLQMRPLDYRRQEIAF